MKPYFFTICFSFCFIALSYSQSGESGPVISFDKEVHDYGTVYTSKTPDGIIEFKIYNKGKKPLILTNVRACCGTLVKEYTREPISPRDSGIVKIEFRVIDRPHRISRTVTIQSNAENRQTAVLRVIGEIVEPPDNSLKL